MSIFRCPHCATPFGDEVPDRCASCGAAVVREGGVPVLLRDPSAVAARIDAARAAGRAEWYDAPQTSVQLHGPYRRHRARRRAYLESMLADEARRRGRPQVGLDLGCGDGTNLTWLAEHVDELYGSDYNVSRARRAAGASSASVVVADATDYPVVDDGVDLVFCNHVLEHVDDDIAALAEIRRILRADGLLVLGVPNEGAACWQLAYRLQPRVRRTTDHVHFYTEASIAERCRAAGLEVEDVHAIGWGVPVWSLDQVLKRAALVDDVFEAIGRRVAPSQAICLYVLARPA